MSDATRTVRIVYSTNAKPALDEATKAKNEAAKAARELQREVESVGTKYQRLAGQLDPAVAATNRYKEAQKTLDAALSHGLISQAQHAAQIEAASKKYLDAGEHVSRFSQLLNGLDKVAASSGALTAEISEQWTGAAEKLHGVYEAVEGLGPTLLVGIGALVAAAAAVGIAFEGFAILKEVLQEGMKTEEVVGKLEATLRANGSAAGYSSHELIEMAGSLVNVSGQSKEAIIEGEGVLSRFTRIGHDVFPQAVKSALDLAASGKEVGAAFTLTGKILEGSTTGWKALAEAGIVLDKGQKARLADMLAMGKVAEYQATVFGLLKEHTEGLALAHAQTLAGALAIAHEKFKLVGEGISSEVLPAIENLFSELVRSLGGWDAVDKEMTAIGHSIGDFIRKGIYGLAIAYQDMVREQDEAFASIGAGFNRFMEGALHVVEVALELQTKLPAWMGGGADASADLAQFKAYEAEVAKAGAARVAVDRQAAQAHAASEAVLIAGYMVHSQALEGLDKTYQSHGRLEDEIAKKTKDAAAAYNEAAKALRDYDRFIMDSAESFARQSENQDKLQAALRSGILAYDAEKKSQEIAAAVEAESIKLRDKHTAAVDKLHTAIDSLTKAHDFAGAAKETANLAALNQAYDIQAKTLPQLAGDLVKKKDVTAAMVVVDADARAATDALRLANAQYTDALTGNKDATRQNEVEVETWRIVLAKAAAGEQVNIDKIRESVAARRADIDAIHDQTAEQQKITDLFNQADYQVAISRIDTSTSAAVQQLETSYLAFLTDSGKKSIDKAQEDLKLLAESWGLSLTDTEKVIKGALQDIQDAATVKKYAGGGLSLYQQYANERAEIERLMAASSDKVHLTVADGLKALEDLHNKYIDSQLSTYSSALGILSQEFGGVFTKLLRFVQILQEIQTLREDVSAIISGLGGLGAVFGSAATATTTNTSAIVALTASVNANSAAMGTSSATSSAGSIAGGAGGAGGGGAAAGAGGALAIVGAFVAAYLVGTQILNVRDRHGFGSASSYQVTNGQAVEAGETAIAESIRKFVKTIEDLAGSTITELDSIGIKVQNSGKAFRAYVGSTLIGEFGTLQEALGAAVQRALSTAQFSKALDPAIKDLISGAAAGFSGNIDDFLASLKLVTDGINQSLPKAASDFRALNVNFDQTFEAQLALFRTHAAAGLQELFGLDLAHWAAGVDDLRDSITGQQKSAYILFEQQRQAFNAENDARRLSILTQIAKTKTDLLAAGVTVATINQITGALNGLKSISAGSGGPGAGDTPGGTLHYNYGQGPTGPNGGAIPGDPGAGHPAPGGNPATIPGFAGQNTANLEALLAELVKELGALPDNIKSSEFNNAQSKNYYSNQLDSAEKDFEKLASDLASAGKSAAEFSSDLSADLANLGLTLNDQRDAITGHKRTAAEDLAIRKEQALQWDAELVLRKANVAQEIIDLQVKIDGAKGQIAYTSVMVQSGQYIARTAVGVAKTVGAAGGFTEAQITAMEQQLDALKGIQGVLDGIKLIDPSEILLGGSGGSGAQQKADALAAMNAELEKLARSGLPSAVGAIVDLGLQLADLTKRTHDAHASELLLAQARQALIDQAKANILSPLLGYLKPNEAAGGTLGVSQFGAAASGIDKQFADAEAAQRKLIETTGQRAIAFWVLQEAHVRALHAAAEQFIGGLGLPVEQARDKVATLQGSLGSLWEAFGKGAVDGQRLTDVLNQMTAQSGSELLGLAQSLLSTMGQTTEAAKVKAALDEADFDIKVIQLNILYQGYLALGQVSDQVKATLDHALGIINDPKNHPDFQAIELAAIAQKNTGAANTQLQAANDNLAAADKLTQWQKSLLTNPAVSPLAPRAQVAQSRADLNALIAKAEAGDQSSRDRFTQEADAYLSLYRSTFGMTGDYAKEIMSLSGVADVLKAELLGNPAQNLATGPPAWYYGPDVGGTSSGTGPTAGGPGSGYVAPNVPVVTVDIGPIVSALGKSGDLYILTRDAGADAIRYHVAALDLYRTIAERLGSIDNRMADMNSSLQRVINKIAA